jgi:hypothetical protein
MTAAANRQDTGAAAPDPRVRLGVELTEPQVAFLRGLSRPARTGGPRTLGAKFVAAGVLAAAIELLEHTAIDMHGVAAGDLHEMTARARDALERAGATHGVARRRRCLAITLAAHRATRACATQPTRPRSTRSSRSCGTPPMTVTAGACER